MEGTFQRYSSRSDSASLEFFQKATSMYIRDAQCSFTCVPQHPTLFGDSLVVVKYSKP